MIIVSGFFVGCAITVIVFGIKAYRENLRHKLSAPLDLVLPKPMAMPQPPNVGSAAIVATSETHSLAKASAKIGLLKSVRDFYNIGCMSGKEARTVLGNAGMFMEAGAFPDTSDLVGGLASPIPLLLTQVSHPDFCPRHSRMFEKRTLEIRSGLHQVLRGTVDQMVCPQCEQEKKTVGLKPMPMTPLPAFSVSTQGALNATAPEAIKNKLPQTVPMVNLDGERTVIFEEEKTEA
jgi:hypothetical protein